VAASRLTEPQAGELGPTGRPLSGFPDPEPLVEHGPARVVAVCNQKGGVGKTTTTINLGAALAEQGRRVLLVDFDPQGALSVGLGIQPHDIDSTIYNLLMERDITVHDVLHKTHVDGLDLLPSNIDLSGAEVQLVHEVGREYVLGGVLQPLIQDYDVIMIDCQPSERCEIYAMNSSVTWESATSVMSSLCLEISASSRSNGPSKTERWTSKALPGAAARAASSGSPARSISFTRTLMMVVRSAAG
jgi:Mrp family chromosome partitioning ATPase